MAAAKKQVLTCEKCHVKLELDSYKRESDIYRAGVSALIASIEKRLWRLEMMIMFSTATTIGIGAMMMTKL